MLQAPVLQLMALARAVAAGYRVPGYSKEDMRQEAALAMLQAAPALPFDAEELQRLRDVANRRCYDVLRAQLRKPRVLPMEGYDTAVGEGVDREVAAQEAADVAIVRMTPQQRNVTLRTRDGQEDDMIAVEAGSSVAAVRVARSQAINRVREALR